MKRGCLVALTVCSSALLAFGLLAVLYLLPRAREYNTSAKAASIEVAMRAYREEFGSYPSGAAAGILRALLGHNERSRPFLHQEMTRFLDADGEPIDDWGRPFRIETGQSVRVLSAGKNGVFGDADDVDSALAFEIGKSAAPEPGGKAGSP